MSRRFVIVAVAVVLIAGLAIGIQQAWASGQAQPVKQTSPLHPRFALLDADGNNVLTSGQAVSTMKTCGACHDTDFITSHSFHADLGLTDYQKVKGAQPWDASNGYFGQWDALNYRYLSQAGDERLDLGTPDWLMQFGDRVPGGGPATTSRDGKSLLTLSPDAANPETSVLDPKTGQPVAWDWQKSGVLEMSCFLCHLDKPDSAARTTEIRNGNFGWANTATLNQLGVVTKSGSGWTFNATAFDADGLLKQDYVQLQDPTNANCAACHGQVHVDQKTPLTYTGCSLDQPQTATTGQLVAAQKISASGMNIADKDNLKYAWDIHAERALKCTDCHFSLNNPAQSQRDSSENLAHLQYDPRRLEIGEYVQKPDHNFARGQSAQFNVSPELKGTMRRCDSCHDAQTAHADWLPYVDRHMQVLDCETCHIPEMHAPAVQSYDWTVITPAGEAISQCRGVEGTGNSQNDLITGFSPVFLKRTNVDGHTSLSTYNLVSSWFWVYDDAKGNQRPVRQIDLEAAYLQNGQYTPEVIKTFDANNDGTLQTTELRIDTPEKQAFVAGRLSAIGLKNPRIVGQVQPYSINHDVVRGETAISACATCHSDNSRVGAAMTLATYLPGGVLPQFVNDTNVKNNGTLDKDSSGALKYTPATSSDGVYVFGHNRVFWIDLLGALAFVGALAGVSGHATMRYLAAKRMRKSKPHTQPVYMYAGYERFWHWLQTVSIILLLFTGLIIHRPDIFGVFAFRGVVTLHNILAVILIFNAALSLFWHVTNGEIRQYIPRPIGFFDDAIVQAKYYLRGIFKGEAHPFEKRRDKKMNPLQQATYFGLLNVLLPLQIVTGALMWGAQQWPQLANMLGGLPVLAPFHSLVAWLLAAFIVGHVYLTTTGATPLEAMRGMVTGWEDIETHEGHDEPIEKPGQAPAGATAESAPSA
ncbi:MAG: cytochrome b/b6 domain-containing protein [Anaerolineae bacterium]